MMGERVIMDKKRIARIQLVIIFFSMFSFSYFLAEEEYQRNFSDTLITFIKKPMIPLVSAQSTNHVNLQDYGCCASLINGDKCAVTYKDSCNVAQGFLSNGLCEFASFCQKGCCYNSNLGIFDKNVLRSDCNIAGWRFDSLDTQCNNQPGASKGCCILGDTTDYITQGQCQTATLTLARSTSAVVEWDASMSEVSCIARAAKRVEGACVNEGGTCDFITEQECVLQRGEFYEGFLCTAQELNASCEPTTSTMCVESKDGVYFKDSCGNPANIYDANKVNNENYWKSIISPENSCNPHDADGNANSATCGNCDRLAGGYCGSASKNNFAVDYGNNYCKPTFCEFEDQIYENGESWCRYDGSVGNGTDTVGSRHWKYVCNFGQVQLEPCADYRNEVCIQTREADPQDELNISRNAECVANDWQECILLASEGRSGIEKCAQTPQCEVRRINIASHFKFNACTPKFPGGFDFNDEDSQKTAQGLCEVGSQKCIVVKKPTLFHGCEVIANEDCRTQEFTNKMNEFCTSLGDCGGYVNYIGDYEENFRVRNAPRHLRQNKINELIALATPITNVYATFEQLEEFKEGGRGLAAANSGRPGSTFGFSDRQKELWKIFPGNIPVISQLINFYLWLVFTILDPILRFFYADCDNIVVKFNCEAWTPPSGGENCEICNEGDLPCSKYRCESLGAACKFINEGSEEELCVHHNIGDVAPPHINPVINETDQTISQTNSGISISSSDGCFEPYEDLVITFSTNEPARCRWDTELNNFSEMEFPAGSSNHKYNHEINYFLLDPSSGQSQGLNITAQNTIYVLCQDVQGNGFRVPYTIDFCINEGPDVKAPKINRIAPVSGSYISINTTSHDLFIYTNELSTCRWDLADIRYENMINDFTCTTELGDRSLYGYLCNASLDVGDSLNKYYIRCMDQPWLAGTSEENSRNANPTSTIYEVKKASSPIKITSILPNSKIESGNFWTTIDIKVTTTGGAPNHHCAYSAISFEEGLIPMFVTGGNTHVQPHLGYGAGEHTTYVVCSDETGDTAKAQENFVIDYDSVPPQIARVWSSGGTLYVVTTEKSECSYSESAKSGCGFSFEQGTSMGNGVMHTLGVVKGDTYHIKCKDKFGNVPGGCSIIVTIP